MVEVRSLSCAAYSRSGFRDAEALPYFVPLEPAQVIQHRRFNARVQSVQHPMVLPPVKKHVIIPNLVNSQKNSQKNTS